MSEATLVIDADGHVMEPEGCWTERMDVDRWGDWIPRKVTEDGCYETVWTGGVVRGGGRELQDQMAAAVGLSPQELYDLMASLRVPGGYDPNARVVDLDADGIDAAVVYPSQGMFFGPCDPIPALHDVEFVADCQRVYNDWIAEFCAAYPRRLFGVAGVPLQDVDREIAEAQRACGDLGLVAVFLRPSAYLQEGERELPLHHPAYDPFWAAMSELGAPVAFHPGVHIDTPGACRKFELVADSENMSVTNMATDEIHGGSALGQAVGNAVDMIVTMGRVLMGGVCERFPDLKLVFLESGGGWVPTQLERMDEQVEAFPLERRKLSLLPSEYFTRQCWVCFEAEEWNLAACAERLGPDRVLWATDYPHPEYHAGVVDELREHLEPLDDDARAMILGQNAVAAYDLAIDGAATDVVTALEFDTELDLGRMRRERHGRLLDAMRDAGLDALLLLGQSNVGYATGARVPAADQARAMHRRGVALVTADAEPPHLWTWYPDGAPPELPVENIHAGVSLESDEGARRLLDVVATWVPPGGALVVDETTMPLRAAMLDAGRPLVDAGPALGEAKAHKTHDEIECVRRAEAINEAAIADLAPGVRPGMPATDLTGRFLRRVIELGATWNNVDPIWQVMPSSIDDGPYSATGGVVFPTVTTPRPLERGDVVWVDNGLAYLGYMSDYGHTWIVGDSPDARQRDQCRRWREVVAATLDATKPGATARDLTRAASDAAGVERPWLPHLYLAHGSGTESAEPPFVGTDLGDEFDETVVLAPGMVMVLEPVIWDDGNGGFRAEQVIAVTDDGWTSLSNLTWEGWE